MSQSTKETRPFSAKIGNFRQHSARIGNIRQFSAMKKRYNGMRQKKTRKPAKASAEAGFFVLGKENLMTIEYMARVASRHETAFAHAMLHAIAVYRSYGGRFVWPTA